MFLAISDVRANYVIVEAKAGGRKGFPPGQGFDDGGEEGVGEGREGGGREGGEGGGDVVLEDGKEGGEVGEDDLGAEEGEGDAD